MHVEIDPTFDPIKLVGLRSTIDLERFIDSRALSVAHPFIGFSR